MKPVNTWRYQLTPAGDGTDVTESFTLTPSLFIRTYWTLFGGMRSKTNRRGMAETLNRIKTVAEKA
jgi:hypothetical protein